MNNDEQIIQINNRFDILEMQNRNIMEMLYAKLKIGAVVLEEETGAKNLQIMSVHETTSGVLIRVK